MFKQIVIDYIGQKLENYVQGFDSNSIQFTGFPSSEQRASRPLHASARHAAPCAQATCG